MDFTSRRETHRVSLVIDASLLSQLDAILAGLGTERNYTVNTLNNETIERDDLDGILALPNSKERAIVTITAKTIPDTGSRASVSLGVGSIRYSSKSTVGYDLYGSDQEVYHIGGQLDDWIEEAKPWYSWIALLDFLGCAFLMVFLGGLLLAGFIFVWAIVVSITQDLSQPLSRNPDTVGSVVGPILVYGSIFIPFVLAWPLSLLRGVLFPVMTFATGYGVRRYESRRQILSIFTGFMIGVLSSLVASGIFAWTLARLTGNPPSPQ